MPKTLRRFAILLTSSLASLAIASWLHERLAPRPSLVQLAPPAPGVFRLYVLGASTAEGAPYNRRCDIGKLVAYLFANELAGRPIEVKNLAASGAKTSHALERARTIASLRHEPDSAVALLYSGDNEFRQYDDPLANPLAPGRAQRSLFDVAVVSKEVRAKIFETYAAQVEQLADILQRAGVEVILFTGAINLGDRQPNRSVLDDPGHEEALRVQLEQAEAAFDRGDLEGSLRAFQDALALEPHFAWTHKRAGDVLRRRGRFDEARAAYQAAVDWDGSPMSFTSIQNAALREIAGRRSLVLVDAELALRAASPEGLPGYDLFWDQCHPTLAGYLRIASAAADVFEVRYQVHRVRANPSLEEIESAFDLDRRFMADVLISRGQSLYGLSLLTWSPAARLARARHYLDEAEKLVPGDSTLLCSRAVLSLIEGDLEQSRAHWRAALSADPTNARFRVQHPYVAWLLRSNGVEDPLSMLAP